MEYNEWIQIDATETVGKRYQTTEGQLGTQWEYNDQQWTSTWASAATDAENNCFISKYRSDNEFFWEYNQHPTLRHSKDIILKKSCIFVESGLSFSCSIF